jgi:hypothetical protein
MQQITINQLNADDFEKAIETATKKNSITNMVGYFPNLIGTATVCEILGRHPNTITKLIKEKKLTPTNTDSSKYQFRLSEILIHLIKTQAK